MVRYDSSVIQQLADALYARADSMVRAWTLLGALAGFVVGGGVGAFAFRTEGAILLAVLAAVLLALVGWSVGTRKAFFLRLAAQTALCQVQIERNTAAMASPER